MAISPETTLGELAATYPAAVSVLQRRGIEFCCHGGRTLAEIGGDPTALVALAAEIEEAVAGTQPRTTWAARPLSELIAHVVDAFHDPIRNELPRLIAQVGRLQDRCASHNRSVAVIQFELARFAAVFGEQMAGEERELFPLIADAERATLDGAGRLRLTERLRAAEAGNRDAGQSLRVLRQITDGFNAPPTACPTLRALYRDLHELEQLMQLHVHLEQNVLFTRAAALTSTAIPETH